MWYKVVESGESSVALSVRGAEKVEPVGIRPNRSINSSNRAVLTETFAAFSSFRRHVSRQSSNPGRRERPSQDSGRVQAGDRREIRATILHHKSRWEGCSSVSLRGVGTDRAEAGGALQFQSHEEEVLGSDELLRAAGRNGWAGPGFFTSIHGIQNRRLLGVKI